MLWAGNNENEAALIQNWYDTNSNFELYKQDYLKLYQETIEKIVKIEDSSRPFVLSREFNFCAELRVFLTEGRFLHKSVAELLL